jgi:Tfp pilus assembly protein PilF
LRALSIRTKAFGIAHPRTIQSYKNIAINYKGVGNMKKADEYFKKAIEAKQQFTSR